MDITVGLFFLFIALIVCAIVMRATISLYNSMAGGADSPRAVPEPSIEKALGLTFVALLFNLVICFIVGLVIDGVATATDVRGSSVSMNAQLVFLPIIVLIMTGVLSLMLPTALGLAFLVAFGYLFILSIIVGTSVIGLFVILRS